MFSKDCNKNLGLHNIIYSMSRAGTPTDNGAMESINGWIKEELFTDFHITGKKSIRKEIAEYIRFFNEERPAYSLHYLTPKQYQPGKVCSRKDRLAYYCASQEKGLP